jgi:circadian clock protein KaiC
MLRYFELRGTVRQAISMFKKRVGRHERTIRQFNMSRATGMRVGEVLSNFYAILTGVPAFQQGADFQFPDEDTSAVAWKLASSFTLLPARMPPSPPRY